MRQYANGQMVMAPNGVSRKRLDLPTWPLMLSICAMVLCTVALLFTLTTTGVAQPAAETTAPSDTTVELPATERENPPTQVPTPAPTQVPTQDDSATEQGRSPSPAPTQAPTSDNPAAVRPPAQALSAPDMLGVRPGNLADIAEGLLGAVVNIATSQNIGSSREVPVPEFPENSPFKEFFDDFLDREGEGPRRRAQSLGSGFIVDPAGYVVTNNHVIEGADEIRVVFSDGLELTATIVGRDSKTDLAVLKVDADDALPFVEFGDSDQLRVGDWVLAIGNPFGLGGSLTVGVVSARNRNINSGPYDDFIQTDAAINRGNSGGPLFDLSGKVVGVNTAIFSPSGVSVGIGFSVPAGLAKRVVTQLIDHGKTRRGWIGVRIQDVGEDIAESLGMNKAHGAFIAGVTKDGPASQAGIKAGDVIIQFDGQEVAAMRELPRLVADTDPGSNVDVMLIRDGERVTLTIRIGLLAEEEAEVAEADEDSQDVVRSVLGMQLAVITDVLREEHELSDKVKGVLILEVAENSPAAEKEIGVGTVIVEVAQTPVASPREVESRVGELLAQGRKAILLLLSNAGGDLRFVAVRVAN